MIERSTIREAIAAQVLSEVDELLTRVEELPENIASVEEQLQATTTALIDAADNFRLAVTAFSDQARIDLREHAQRTVARTMDEQRSVLQEAAHLAFRLQADDQARALATALTKAAEDFKEASRSRFLHQATLIVITSGITALVVSFFFR